MYLPMSTAVASRWGVWDYASRAVRSLLPAAAGECIAELPAVPDNELWFIDRLRVMCDSSTATLAYCYVDLFDDDHVIDGTLTGNFDVADNAAPIALLPTEQLRVKWTGASAGAVGRLRAQITVMRRDPAAG